MLWAVYLVTRETQSKEQYSFPWSVPISPCEDEVEYRSSIMVKNRNALLHIVAVTTWGCALVTGFLPHDSYAERLARGTLRGGATLTVVSKPPGSWASETGHKNDHRQKLPATVHLWLSLRGFGRYRIELPFERLIARNSLPSQLTHLQGTAYSYRGGRTSESIAALTLVQQRDQRNSVARLFLRLQPRRPSNMKGAGLYEVRFRLTQIGEKLSSSHLQVIRSKRRRFQEISLATERAKIHSSSLFQGVARMQRRRYPVVRTVIEGDYEYSERVDGRVEEELSTILNAVDALFRRDLGIILEGNIVREPQPYSFPIALDASRNFMIHTEMLQRRPKESRDVHILLTGKTPVGKGLFYLAGAVPRIGSVCRYADKAAAFTIHWQDGPDEEATTQDDIVTTAHEVGHLFGAEHDDDFTSARPFIMNSGSNGYDASEFDRFSRFSLTQVAGFLGRHGACLGAGQLRAEELVTTLLPKVRRGRLQVTALNQIGRTVPDATVTLLCPDSGDADEFVSVAETATNARGRALFARGFSTGCLVRSGEATASF